MLLYTKLLPLWWYEPYLCLEKKIAHKKDECLLKKGNVCVKNRNKHHKKETHTHRKIVHSNLFNIPINNNFSSNQLLQWLNTETIFLWTVSWYWHVESLRHACFLWSCYDSKEYLLEKYWIWSSFSFVFFNKIIKNNLMIHTHTSLREAVV